jgi:Transposase DDE domain
MEPTEDQPDDVSRARWNKDGSEVRYLQLAHNAWDPQKAQVGGAGDHRDDLPQVVIGMAVARDGIPVRVWCWPGDTADSALIRQVKDDMRDWCLSNVIWVADRGFTSAENRRYLRKGGGSYIIGEKLRSGSAAAGGRAVRHLLQPRGRRARRRRPREDDHPPAEVIAESDQLSRDKRAELRGVISTSPA